MMQDIGADLVEHHPPVRSTFVSGVSRSTLDLRGPRSLHVLLAFLETRQQLRGQACPVINFESQRFFENLSRRFGHDEIVSGNPHLFALLPDAHERRRPALNFSAMRETCT